MKDVIIQKYSDISSSNIRILRVLRGELRLIEIGNLLTFTSISSHLGVYMSIE